MRLSRLTGLEREKLADEYGELVRHDRAPAAILAERELAARRVIVDELDEIQERYGDERRTEIVAAEGDINIEDLIQEEDMVVTICTPATSSARRSPSTARRGAAGGARRAMETRDEDFVKQLFVASTTTTSCSSATRARST